ncbi:MAG: PleD family two-component system response regulator [Flavobacteriales bacterium]
MKTILLIEDNNDIRENTCELLELKGYEVIFAMDGKTRLASAKQNKPDIILCDIMMPETDGYEVIGKLKNDIETAHIPFIFLTASNEKRDEEAGYTMGANGYIRKPFDAEELFLAVEKCLNAE